MAYGVSWCRQAHTLFESPCFKDPPATVGLLPSFPFSDSLRRGEPVPQGFRPGDLTVEQGLVLDTRLNPGVTTPRGMGDPGQRAIFQGPSGRLIAANAAWLR